ncbi:MAG: hypothetical protein ABIJ09_07380 [Pseudomonadota bacterium]
MFLRSVLCSGVVLLALAAVARASQVSHEETSLDEVLSQTEVAVLLQLEDPAMRPVAIPVPSDGTKDCGAYRYGAWRARVTRVVHSEPASGVAVGQTLVVFPADTPALIAISREACLTGMTESPIFGRFKGVEPMKGQPALALLRWLPGYGWAEAVSGSWLKPVDAKKIAGRLTKRDLGMNPALLPARDSLCVITDDCVQSFADCSLCGTCPDWNGWAATHATSARVAASCKALHPEPKPHKPGEPVPPPPDQPACSPCPQPEKVGPNQVRVECKDMRCRFAGS